MWRKKFCYTAESRVKHRKKLCFIAPCIAVSSYRRVAWSLASAKDAACCKRGIEVDQVDLLGVRAAEMLERKKVVPMIESIGRSVKRSLRRIGGRWKGAEVLWVGWIAWGRKRRFVWPQQGDRGRFCGHLRSLRMDRAGFAPKGFTRSEGDSARGVVWLFCEG